MRILLKYSLNISLLIISLLVSMLFVEYALRLCTPFPIHGSWANKTWHETLGWKISPQLEGIDENGFRNEYVMQQPDIITIGDSHTFCVNVPSKFSWPQLLSRQTSLEVYNFGILGYGIRQYEYLLHQAIKKKPKKIVIGMYLLNDLHDFITLPYFRYYGSPEAQQKHGRNAARLVWGIFSPKKLWNNSAIISCLRFFLTDFVYKIKLKFIDSNNKNVNLIAYGSHMTLLGDTKLRFGLMDVSQPKIANAVSESKLLLSGVLQEAIDNGIDVAVLFIPSKEAVFYSYLEKNKLPTDKYVFAIFRQEEELVNEFTLYFNELGVETYYVRDAMTAAVENGIKIYPSTTDGHPNAAGYKIYADAAFSLL